MSGTGGESRGFAAVLYSEPGVLGLLANAVSALLVAMHNFSTHRAAAHLSPTNNILSGVHLVLIGGVTQLVAGLLTFRKFDHLGGTAFLAFAALWSGFGASRIISGAVTLAAAVNSTADNLTALAAVEHATAPDAFVSDTAVASLVAYICVSAILAFCSATANYIMPPVFGAITAVLVFEAVLAAYPLGWAAPVAGSLELIILAAGLYGSVALLLKGITQRYVLPGFGNALFNVLLLGAGKAASGGGGGGGGAGGNERKKNTKYAEPMALCCLCDAVAAVILAFYCFGFPHTFTAGALWLSVNSAPQLLAAYYAFLREDAYHGAKSVLRCVFWLVHAWQEFVVSTEQVALASAAAGELDSARLAMVGDWFLLVAAVVLLLVSLDRDILETVENSSFALLAVAAIPQIPARARYAFLGAACCAHAAVNLYATFARLINSIAEKPLVPIGAVPLASQRLRAFLGALRRCCSCGNGSSSSSNEAGNNQPGPSMAQLSDAAFYLCNGVAAMSALHSTEPLRARLSLPWVLLPGALLQLFVARVGLLHKASGGSVMPFCYAAFWAVWAWLRLAGFSLNISPGDDTGFTAGAIAGLIINMFLILLAAYGNLVLLFHTLVMQILVICLLLFTLESLPQPLEDVMLALLALSCAYGALASVSNCVFERKLLPLGRALLRAPSSRSSQTPAAPPCVTPVSRRTSGLREIAALLGGGAVCGVPTDTVYALAASCRHPGAIQRIYAIKDRPQEKPVCICISSLEQLASVRPPFSPLLWEFMSGVYPGGISCIVPKGDWLLRLGVGEAYDLVGTADSIMIRVPDSTVTSHLVSMTGPLAITSANPSGEPDSTHHDMVIGRLGDKLDGVLCDGDSNETVASTVVNCLDIDGEGIRILREGCVPAAKVHQIFERVKVQRD
ncbi:uncharacterized protein LOC133349952 [Lethenteron reissneri]|uniref:uncharacterized protein LOC133349952 n=1 Tax=Lethenteron reissneri TaxID=7753 RepID=UPI002AB77ACD|nr:uncharacterized protein LOC133349952 [Lethenteron reissneri]